MWEDQQHLWPPLFERTAVDGVKVVADEAYPSGLSNYYNKLIPIKGMRLLTLEDESVVIGCRDCEATTDELGVMRLHRNREHGVSLGGHTKKSLAEAEAAGLTAEPLVLPRSTLDMTLREQMELAAHIDDWEMVLTGLQDQRNAAIAERDEARAELKRVKSDLAGIRRKAAKMFGIGEGND